MSIPGADWGLEQDPTDDEIRLLFAIIRDASSSTHAPFKAFFAAYDDHFARHQLDKGHDNVVYRLGMRVVHAARRQHHAGRPTNLLPYLTKLLEEHGVTCIENDDDHEPVHHDLTPQPDLNQQSMINHPPRSTRRASFSDARLDETWLDEKTAPLRPVSLLQPARTGLLSQPARRRGRDFGSSQRARSTSSRSTRVPTRTAHQHFHRHSSSIDQSSVDEDFNNPTLLFQPSQTQLEQNADAFYAISQLRTARQCLQVWREGNFHLLQAYEVACNHDSGMLLRQAVEVLQDRAKLERERRSQLSDILAYSSRKRDLALMVKAFSHWDESTQHRKRVTTLAQMHALKVKYFAQWRRVAMENAAKMRFTLARKYVAIWRERTLRNRLALEQADAHFEEALMKRCFARWYWNFCDRQAEGWHERRLMRGMFTAWRAKFETTRRQNAQALDLRQRHLTGAALQQLVRLHDQQQCQIREVEEARQKSVAVTCLQTLQSEAKLRPVARAVIAKVDVNLKTKAVRVWSLHLQLVRQAAEVDRKRILQTAWTHWNDALRCKALAQRIDARVLAESLYKWILEYRLRTLIKEKNAHLARAILAKWRQRTEQANLTLEDAEILFASRQRQRLLRSGLNRLHNALRIREDGHRAAIEFANSRAVPKAVVAWRGRLEHLHRLDKWAVDARFYCLGTQTLSVWRDKATKHHNQRLRDAYRQLRAQVKIRLAGTCLSLWRERSARLVSMRADASDHMQARTQSVASSALQAMQTRASHRQNLIAQAETLDQTKLLSSALSALLISHVNHFEMSAQAVLFRQESDTVLLVNTWKKLQWRAFTTARQRETAEAFRTRTRELRVRSMMRFWAGKSAGRRAKRSFEAQREITTESPSLRPASRRAAASSQSHFGEFAGTAEELPSFLEIGPSPFEEEPNRTLLNTTTTTLPGYLRTPSRSSRRSTRFHTQYQSLYQRPVLPTPAHATPLVFDPGAFLGTSTPAYPPPMTTLTMPIRSKEKNLANVEVKSTSNAPASMTTTTTKPLERTATSPHAAAPRSDRIPPQTSTPLRQQHPSGRRSTTPTATPQITPFSRKLRAGGVSMPSLSLRPKLSTTLGRSSTSASTTTADAKPSAPSPLKSNGTASAHPNMTTAPVNGGPTAPSARSNEALPGTRTSGPDERDQSPLTALGSSPLERAFSGDDGEGIPSPSSPAQAATLGRSIMLGTGKSVRFASPTSASLARAKKGRFG